MGTFVLIGGGENGRKGTKYELEKIDQEIVHLLPSNSEKNFLFLAHGNSHEEEYYRIMKKNYKKLGCNCDILYKSELKEEDIVKNKINWANIIYIGGGNTLNMMNLWRKYSFNNILNTLKEKEKIFCGISAGAISLCKCGVSDSRKSKKNDCYIRVNGMNFFNVLLCPSFDEKINYIENINNIMKREETPMIALEKGTALILEKDEYRIIKSLEEKKAYKIYYYKNNRYIYELTNKGKKTNLELFCKNIYL